MEWRRGAPKQGLQNKRSGDKIAGQEFSPCFRENNLQCLQSKQEETTEEEEMKQQQRMVIVKDPIKENLIQKEECMLTADGGFLSCWRQTVRKRGFTHDGNILCRDGISGWRSCTREMRKERWRKCISTEVAQMSQECGRQCWASAQDHEGHSMEREEHRS